MIEQKRNNKPKFFLAIGLIGLFAVLVGFSTTFFIPLAKAEFKAPVVVYIHGALALGWVCIFIIQSLLIQANNFKQHKRIGFLGVAIAIGITITFVPVGLYQVERELALGLGQLAISSLVGTLTTAVIFIGLVLMGIFRRHEPSTHKRLMLLATILLLWPAWFRFRHLFPAVPNPEIWFAIVLADSLIVVAIIWDKITYRRINPTLLYVGVFIIIEHATEAYAFDNALWRELANTLYGLLT